ncbi:MAG: hypothetical protein LIO62_09065 [Clostridiales bacterium]|nr:hypothetical protein [Clostridiales bacterium]
MEKGKIKFTCNNKELENGFNWAKNQALSYSHEDGLVGCWYEAALPKRNSFCIRDVCHHITGAHYLGLDAHSKNMLLKFAQSVAQSRDYCSFWEITGDYAPTKVDYSNDNDFWYNLPANFDLVDACLRSYLLSADNDYIESYDFNRFYDLTVNEYVKCWDSDNDGIPNRKVFKSRRGIPSYDEQKGMENVIVAADLLAAQIRGYISYSKLKKIKNEHFQKTAEEADRLLKILNNEWWNEKEKCFYGAKHRNGSYINTMGSPHMLAYFDTVTDSEKKKLLLNSLHENGKKGIIVEIMSHYPEIFYKNSDKEKGLYWLKRCIDPNLERREYPEVSFSVVGAYIEGLMGICANAVDLSITTINNLPNSITFAGVENCPMFGGSINCFFENGSFTLENNTGKTVLFNGVPVEHGCRL